MGTQLGTLTPSSIVMEIHELWGGRARGLASKKRHSDTWRLCTVFSVYLCRNESDAEDLLQDTLLNAFRKFHQFQPGTNMKAWLFRIARNAHIDRARRKKREPESSELKDVAASPKNPAEGVEKELSRWMALTSEKENALFELFGDEVNRFLNELPVEFRLALVLCDVEGLSYQEIGESLECPVGTVRSRISRARSHLREKLQDYAAEQGFHSANPSTH